MALGITFIYSIMKMINWGMGEFYMIGSYVQYALIATLLGPRRWYLALPLAMGAVFLLGLVVQRFLLRPMFVGGIERRDEYATIITIALMVLFRNLAIVLGGPRASRRRPESRRHPDRRDRRAPPGHAGVRRRRGAGGRGRRAAGARLPRLSGERRHLDLQGLRDHRHRRAGLDSRQHRGRRAPRRDRGAGVGLPLGRLQGPLRLSVAHRAARLPAHRALRRARAERVALGARGGPPDLRRGLPRRRQVDDGAMPCASAHASRAPGALGLRSGGAE